MSLNSNQAEKLNDLMSLILMPLGAECFITLIAFRLPDGRGAVEAIGQPLSKSGEAAMASLGKVVTDAIKSTGARVVDGKEWELGKN